jgi:YVTN family beta-propeller protein
MPEPADTARVHVTPAARPGRTHVSAALLLAIVAYDNLCPGGAIAAPARLFVSAEDGNEIVVIDPDRQQVVGRADIGKRPRGVRLSPDGRTLYVALSGSPKLPPGADESALPPPNRAADGIGVVDVSSDTPRLLRVLPSGQDPEAFDLSSDGQRLVISNEETAEVSVVDVAGGQIVSKLAVGKEPEGVTRRPDGRVFYVTSESDNEVVAIDARSSAIVGRIEVGPRPRAVAFTPDSRFAFVSCELGAAVVMVDAQRHRARKTIEIPSAGARPMGVAVAPDGKTVFVSNGRGRTVSVLDARSGRVLATIDDVGVRPWGLVVSRDGRTLYTANGPSDDVSVIDVGARKVVKKIAVAGMPWGAALRP